MRRVRLDEGEVYKDAMDLIPIFVQAANVQGFEVEWVEAVLLKAMANNCTHFREIILDYIEIVPTKPTASTA